jgi:hypothetical protein
MKMKTGSELEAECKKYGVYTDTPIYQSTSGTRRADDAELQRRLIAVKRHFRESRMWWLAFISAVASVISAATALVAILASK